MHLNNGKKLNFQIDDINSKPKLNRKTSTKEHIKPPYYKKFTIPYQNSTQILQLARACQSLELDTQFHQH